MSFHFAIRTKGNNVVIIPSDIDLKLVQSTHAQGTYHSCEIQATGDVKALWQLLNYLGYSITIIDERGEEFWNGYIHETTIEFGAHVFGKTLEGMYNRIRAISGGEGTLSYVTAWLEHERSVLQYGMKELQISMPDSSVSQINDTLELIIEESGLPQDTIELVDPSGATDATASMVCYGFMQTLDWTYYQNPYGIIDTWERTSSGIKVGQTGALHSDIVIEDGVLKYIAEDGLTPFASFQENEGVRLTGLLTTENNGLRNVSRITDGREMQFTVDLAEDASTSVTITPNTDWAAFQIMFQGPEPWRIDTITVPVTPVGVIDSPLRARLMGAPFTGIGVPLTVIKDSITTFEGSAYESGTETEATFSFDNVELQPDTVYWIAFYVDPIEIMSSGGYWIGTAGSNGYPVSFRHSEDYTWNVNYQYLGIPFRLSANWPIKTLITDIVNEGQFFNSILHDYSSTLMVRPFRDGNGYALTELSELLPMVRLQAVLDIERNLIVKPERTRDNFEYYLFKDGTVRRAAGDSVPPHLVKSGTYYKLADVAFVNSALDSMESLSYVWVDMVTYNASTNTSTLTARAELKAIQSL